MVVVDLAHTSGSFDCDSCALICRRRRFSPLHGERVLYWATLVLRLTQHGFVVCDVVVVSVVISPAGARYRYPRIEG